MTLTDLTTLFSTHWGAAVAIGSMFFGLTVLSVRMLDPGIRHTIALRLMGVEQENWCKSFCALFDSCFGRNHLSLLCIIRSAIASLLAVSILWLIFGAEAGLGGRTTDTLPFWQLALIALGINLVADYVSLLETRWLLGHMQRWQSAWAQALALVVDAVVTGAIILAAIFAYQASPLYDGAAMSVGEIIGVFSVFGVLFYSTFLTSVWTWGYILSSWVMRLFGWLKLDKILDMEDNLPFVVATVVALVTGGGAMAASIPLVRDEESGTNMVEEALCWTFGGEVCHSASQLALSEDRADTLELYGCSTGAPLTCWRRGHALLSEHPNEALRYFQRACDSGSGFLCYSAGRIYVREGGSANGIQLAVRFFEQSCDLGHAWGCTELGKMYLVGSGVEENILLAEVMFRIGCEGGNGEACFQVGIFDFTASPRDRPSALGHFEYSCGQMPDHIACDFAERLRATRP